MKDSQKLEYFKISLDSSLMAPPLHINNDYPDILKQAIYLFMQTFYSLSQDIKNQNKKFTAPPPEPKSKYNEISRGNSYRILNSLPSAPVGSETESQISIEIIREHLSRLGFDNNAAQDFLFNLIHQGEGYGALGYSIGRLFFPINELIAKNSDKHSSNIFPNTSESEMRVKYDGKNKALRIFFYLPTQIRAGRNSLNEGYVYAELTITKDVALNVNDLYLTCRNNIFDQHPSLAQIRETLKTASHRLNINNANNVNESQVKHEFLSNKWLKQKRIAFVNFVKEHPIKFTLVIVGALLFITGVILTATGVFSPLGVALGYFGVNLALPTFASALLGGFSLAAVGEIVCGLISVISKGVQKLHRIFHPTQPTAEVVGLFDEVDLIEAQAVENTFTHHPELLGINAEEYVISPTSVSYKTSKIRTREEVLEFLNSPDTLKDESTELNIATEQESQPTLEPVSSNSFSSDKEWHLSAEVLVNN